MTRTCAGTIESNLRAPYAIGGVAAELAMVESKAHDGEYQCRLCAWGIIHEYQTDSSSKQPAPVGVIEKMLKKCKTDILTLDKGRSISGWVFLIWKRVLRLRLPSFWNWPFICYRYLLSVLQSTNFLFFCAYFFNNVDVNIYNIKSYPDLSGFRTFAFYLLTFDFGCNSAALHSLCPLWLIIIPKTSI